MSSNHARFDVNRFQWHDIFFNWIAHYQNFYVIYKVCFDDVSLWIDASINQIRVVEDVKNRRHKESLKDVYDDAYAIDDVINQFENNVSLRKKILYLDQINVFYATLYQIVQQSKVWDIIKRFDYVQQ
jgi:hypothetical protein